MNREPSDPESPMNPNLGKNGPPVLFVHGMWHAGWCWERLIPWFEAAGFAPKALNLSEHQRREGEPIRIKGCSLERYVNDLRSEIATFDKTPILVGHSLGCLLIEIVMSDVRPPAVVLLAPTRHSIFRWSVVRFLLRHPLRFIQLLIHRSMWPPICTPKLCREMLFSPALPETEVRKWHGYLQNESFKVANHLLWGCGPKPAPPSGIPTYVIIGDRDRAVTVTNAKKVAAYHGTKAEIMPGMPHDLMLDLGADKVAEKILLWLKSDTPNRKG